MDIRFHFIFIFYIRLFIFYQILIQPHKKKKKIISNYIIYRYHYRCQNNNIPTNCFYGKSNTKLIHVISLKGVKTESVSESYDNLLHVAHVVLILVTNDGNILKDYLLNFMLLFYSMRHPHYSVGQFTSYLATVVHIKLVWNCPENLRFSMEITFKYF